MGLRESLQGFLQGEPPSGNEGNRELISELRERYSSNRAASRATGIPESTLRGIFNRGTCSESTREKILEGTRAARVREDVSDRDIKFQGTEADGTPRVTDADQLKIQPGTMKQVIEAAKRGDWTEATRRLVDGIGDPTYQRMYNPRTATEGGVGRPDQAGAADDGGDDEGDWLDEYEPQGGDGGGGSAIGGDSWAIEVTAVVFK